MTAETKKEKYNLATFVVAKEKNPQTNSSKNELWHSNTNYKLK
jgi:hypothetical protein